MIIYTYRVCAYYARSLDLSHILNIKNADVLLKSASFRGTHVKCASFRYKQCSAKLRGNQADLVSLRRNQADRASFRKERRNNMCIL